jgi:putative hydrolase of the HAD superfamily
MQINIKHTNFTTHTRHYINKDKQQKITMQLKGIIVDLDNTLIDYDYAHAQGLKAIHKKIPNYAKIPFDTFQEIYYKIYDQLKTGKPLDHDRYTHLLAMGIPIKLALQLTEIYWEETFKHIQTLEYVIEALQWFEKQKIPICIITDLTTYHQHKKMQCASLHTYIQHIVTCQETGVDKPHKKGFILALKKLQCASNEVLVIGDSIAADIAGAQTIRAKSIHLMYGRFSKTKGPKPTYTAKNWKEILEIIQKKIITIHSKKSKKIFA